LIHLGSSLKVVLPIVAIPLSSRVAVAYRPHLNKSLMMMSSGAIAKSSQWLSKHTVKEEPGI
jgi:hypothetical protein